MMYALARPNRPSSDRLQYFRDDIPYIPTLLRSSFTRGFLYHALFAYRNNNDIKVTDDQVTNGKLVSRRIGNA